MQRSKDGWACRSACAWSPAQRAVSVRRLPRAWRTWARGWLCSTAMSRARSSARALAGSCDISDAESVAAAAERVHVELGTPYALINNAGLLRPGTLDQVSLEDWQTVLSINLTGYLLSARAFSPAMRKAGQGAIVNVASIAGV